MISRLNSELVIYCSHSLYIHEHCTVLFVLLARARCSATCITIQSNDIYNGVSKLFEPQSDIRILNTTDEPRSLYIGEIALYAISLSRAGSAQIIDETTREGAGSSRLIQHRYKASVSSSIMAATSFNSFPVLQASSFFWCHSVISLLTRTVSTAS